MLVGSQMLVVYGLDDLVNTDGKGGWTRDPIRTLRIMLYTCIPVNTFSHVSSFWNAVIFIFTNFLLMLVLNITPTGISKQMLEQRQQ